MLRCFIVFISAISVLLSSCATTDSGMLSSGSRRADIVEALSSEQPEDNKRDLALELPFADAVRNTPQVQPAAEEVPADPAPAEASVPVAEEAEEIIASEAEVPAAEIPEAPAEDAAANPQETADAAEEEPEAVQIAEEEDIAEDTPAADEVAEPSIEAPVIEEEIPLQDEPAESDEVAAIHPAMAPRTVPAAMNRIIVDAMIASVVIVIMFTVAAAIRSAYKMPLSYLLSAVIALLISCLPFVICIIIGGMSKIWFSYFILLLSFFIFRSGKGRRDFR